MRGYGEDCSLRRLIDIGFWLFLALNFLFDSMVVLFGGLLLGTGFVLLLWFSRLLSGFRRQLMSSNAFFLLRIFSFSTYRPLTQALILRSERVYNGMENFMMMYQFRGGISTYVVLFKNPASGYDAYKMLV